MHDITTLTPSCQRKVAPIPGAVPAVAWPDVFLPGVHSLDPDQGITSHLPQSLELVSKIEEKALCREVRQRPGRPAPGAERGPLVSYDKSHPGYLPSWCYVPAEPVWCYHVYSKDAHVSRYYPTTPTPATDPGVRKAIFEFSDKSRAHLDHICCNSGHRIKAQVCLTYHDQNPTDGEQIKRDLDRFLKSYRRRFPGEGYLWVLEFQNRGVPHFHLFLTVMPSREMQKKFARSWVKITNGTNNQYWFHARRHAWMKWNMDNGKYATKYVEKQEQKNVPQAFQNVGRFWGCSRNIHPKPDLFGSAEVANLTKNNPTPWDKTMVRHFMDKVLRRFQERQMNYDREGKRRKNPVTGKVNPYRKASLIRQRSTQSGTFKIKNGAKAVLQLLGYIAEHPPDLFTLKHKEESTPF